MGGCRWPIWRFIGDGLQASVGSCAGGRSWRRVLVTATRLGAAGPSLDIGRRTRCVHGRMSSPGHWPEVGAPRRDSDDGMALVWAHCRPAAPSCLETRSPPSPCWPSCSSWALAACGSAAAPPATSSQPPLASYQHCSRPGIPMLLSASTYRQPARIRRSSTRLSDHVPKPGGSWTSADPGADPLGGHGWTARDADRSTAPAASEPVQHPRRSVVVAWAPTPRRSPSPCAGTRPAGRRVHRDRRVGAGDRRPWRPGAGTTRSATATGGAAAITVRRLTAATEAALPPA